MSTPAICVACGVERDYPARRGDRLVDMRCRNCGVTGGLARAGNNPSRAAVKARELFRCPGFVYNGPGKRYVVCAVCGTLDYELNEGDRCRHTGVKVER